MTDSVVDKKVVRIYIICRTCKRRKYYGCNKRRLLYDPVAKKLRKATDEEYVRQEILVGLTGRVWIFICGYGNRVSNKCGKI